MNFEEKSAYPGKLRLVIDRVQLRLIIQTVAAIDTHFFTTCLVC